MSEDEELLEAAFNQSQDKPKISRQQAKERGLKRYFTGPCAYGHTSGRFVGNTCCVACEYKRNYNHRKSEGATTYFTGKPCKQGHISPRNRKSSVCMECLRIKAVKYREKHPEKFKVFHQRYYEKNYDKVTQANRERSKKRTISYIVAMQLGAEIKMSPPKIKPSTVSIHKREVYRKWREKNHERLTEYFKEWAANNKERRRETQFKWRERTRDYNLARARERSKARTTSLRILNILDKLNQE
jgi:hypothetical protein